MSSPHPKTPPQPLLSKTSSPKKRKIDNTFTIKPPTFESLKELLEEKMIHRIQLTHEYNVTQDAIDSIKKKIIILCPHTKWSREFTHDPCGRSFYDVCKGCGKSK